eukprot:4354029-Pleurochrysis_carterae.AAC.2
MCAIGARRCVHIRTSGLTRKRQPNNLNRRQRARNACGAVPKCVRNARQAPNRQPELKATCANRSRRCIHTCKQRAHTPAKPSEPTVTCAERAQCCVPMPTQRVRAPIRQSEPKATCADDARRFSAICSAVVIVRRVGERRPSRRVPDTSGAASGRKVVKRARTQGRDRAWRPSV